MRRAFAAASVDAVDSASSTRELPRAVESSAGENAGIAGTE